MTAEQKKSNFGNAVDPHAPEPVGDIVKRVIEKLKKEAGING